VKQSLCVLTAYNSHLQRLAAFSVPRMHAFAQAHGYETRIIHRDDWQRKRGWIKIEAIRSVLDGNVDFVFWIDVDAVIARRDVGVRMAAVDGAQLHMVWHGHQNTSLQLRDHDFVPHFNSGVMLIRVTDWSRDFFKRVWDVGQLAHHWADQATILHLLGYDNILALGSERPDEPSRLCVAHLDDAWNAIPGFSTTRDPIIHHYAGSGDTATRLRLIEIDATTAPLLESASPDIRQAFFWQLGQWRQDATMRGAAIAERDGAIAERDSARAEVSALRESNSWKLTAAFRLASAFLRRRRLGLPSEDRQ
jgi:hypothetical protein